MRRIAVIFTLCGGALCLCLLSVALLVKNWNYDEGKHLLKANAKDWDYLCFNQNWLPAVCFSPQAQRCEIPSNISYWTIHGLWPNSLKPGADPAFCNNSWHFDVKEIQPVISEMTILWPSDQVKSKPESFWSHEWSKHGTCASSDIELNSVLKYFEKALNLSQKYNLNDAMTKAGFIPDKSKEIQVDEVVQALNIVFGKKVSLECSTYTSVKIPLLSSVEICLDKSLQLIDCPMKGHRNCRGKTLLYYPFPQKI